ncbi:MAG: hypothetical protein V4614_16270 [Pseudomonadota bacterium]
MKQKLKTPLLAAGFFYAGHTNFHIALLVLRSFIPRALQALSLYSFEHEVFNQDDGHLGSAPVGRMFIPAFFPFSTFQC